VTRTVGVEEELLLVDPRTGAPVAVATRALRRAEPADADAGPDDQPDAPGGLVEEELKQEQIETDTRPCSDLAALGEQVRAQRAAAAEVAQGSGARVVAVATSPLEVVPTTTPRSRYGQIVREFGVIGSESLACGMHVHVGVASPEEGVAVLDRIRPWLQVLLAISANSPFADGRDTGYASYRTQSWTRWPSAGPTGTFGSVEAYRRTVEDLLATGTVLDEGMVYFDARLARAYPTVEIRVADVCLRADDAVLVAALARGLVETAARSWERREPAPQVRTEVLRLSTWRASRSGVDGALVHPVTGTPAPAGVVLDALVDHVRDALEADGDSEAVTDLLSALRERGNGARHQRRVHQDGGRLSHVVLDAADLTLA
jgi:carboxylate-amine ligase